MRNNACPLPPKDGAKDGEALYSQQKQPGADCLRSWLLIAKFRLKLKKVGKTTRPFKYDLNQIPYSTSDKHTVYIQVTYSRSDRYIPGIRSHQQNGWTTMDRGSWHYTGGSDQDHPQEKEMQKGKMVVWGGLKNSWEKKRSERQRRKGKIYPFEWKVQKNSKEIRKPSSVINAKK